MVILGFVIFFSLDAFVGFLIAGMCAGPRVESLLFGGRELFLLLSY